MVCTLPPPTFLLAEGLSLLPNFQKKVGGLPWSQFSKGVAWKVGMTFLGGGGGKDLPKHFWGLLYGTKNSILQLSFEFNPHIDIYFFVCLFLLLLNYKAIGAHLHYYFQQSKLRGINMIHICSCLTIFEYIT